MTPKEKAKELVEKMIIGFVDWTYFIPINKTNTTLLSEAKQRALIAVDEILSNDGFSSSILEWDIFISYWQEVKHEIQKL